MMLEEVAEALAKGCREGREREGLKALYAPGAVSVEAEAMPGGGRETAGIAGIEGKHDWWEANFEVTGGDVAGPFLHAPDRFALVFSVEGRPKAGGDAFLMREVALYTVSGGKIVREEFFAAPQPG
ncbi:MAG: nuclear transport factor 2 family protein [Pikeienuella sp.]|uniref:nuclear transport factor 2 family protein n=1 Tax=Pikeienuella sp. TaxID=2831957 RepID=UPI003919E4BE